MQAAFDVHAVLAAADLEVWQRLVWFEGPDDDGHLWLMIDFRAAVQASRTHGPELVARVLMSNVSLHLFLHLPS
jgi:hypothetical protein